MAYERNSACLFSKWTLYCISVMIVMSRRRNKYQRCSKTSTTTIQTNSLHWNLGYLWSVTAQPSFKTSVIGWAQTHRIQGTASELEATSPERAHFYTEKLLTAKTRSLHNLYLPCRGLHEILRGIVYITRCNLMLLGELESKRESFQHKIAHSYIQISRNFCGCLQNAEPQKNLIN